MRCELTKGNTGGRREGRPHRGEELQRERARAVSRGGLAMRTARAILTSKLQGRSGSWTPQPWPMCSGTTFTPGAYGMEAAENGLPGEHARKPPR